MRYLKSFILLIALAFSLPVFAQTNPPAILGTNSQSGLGLIGSGILRLGLQLYDAVPTNITVAPYGTYVMSQKKFGYGLGVAYNLSLGPVQGGPILLVDHVDSFLAFSGGLTLQADIHPLAHWGITSFTVTPFGITAVGTPLGGAGGNNGGLQTINSLGADIKFGHLWGGQWLIGGAYGTRTGAGAYSGGYINGFAGWKKGGIKIGLTATSGGTQ
jgi:hypothetical protein